MRVMTTEAVIRNALDLWNKGKLEQYLACYDPDLEWEMSGVRGRGLKGIPEALAAQMTALPDYRFEIRQIIANGDKAAVETTAIGTNTGTISLPDGSVHPETGKRVFRAMVLMMRVRNARIIEFREYSNEPPWNVQLTGSPASAARKASE